MVYIGIDISKSNFVIFAKDNLIYNNYDAHYDRG